LYENHHFPINNTAFLPNSLKLLTASDDKSSKIIDIKENCIVDTIYKKSPIISVLSNNQEENSFLLGEKNGNNSIHDTRTNKPSIIIKNDIIQNDVDWNCLNSNIIGSISSDKYFIFDKRFIKSPIDTNKFDSINFSKFKFNNVNDSIFATLGLYNEVKIWEIGFGLREKKNFNDSCGDLSFVSPYSPFQSCVLSGGYEKINYSILNF
jgi:WD40 repeat protein